MGLGLGPGGGVGGGRDEMLVVLGSAVILCAVRRWLMVTLCWGCASSGTAPEATTARAASVAETLPAGRGGPALSRAAVVEAVNEGLGAFLQRVELEPSVAEGRFQGFRIVALVPENYWQRVDLEPGDVVTHVNGRSIEQPNEAWEAFEDLKRASQLQVDLLRDGQRRQLLLPIIGEPPPEAQSATQPESTAAAKPAPEATPTP